MGVFRGADKGETLVYYKPEAKDPVIEFDSGYELYISDEEYAEFEKIFDNETLSEDFIFGEALRLAEKHGLKAYVLNNDIWGPATEVDGIGPRGWNLED